MATKKKVVKKKETDKKVVKKKAVKKVVKKKAVKKVVEKKVVEKKETPKNDSLITAYIGRFDEGPLTKYSVKTGSTVKELLEVAKISLGQEKVLDNNADEVALNAKVIHNTEYFVSGSYESGHN